MNTHAHTYMFPHTHEAMRLGAELAAGINQTEHVYTHSLDIYSMCVCIYIHGE